MLTLLQNQGWFSISMFYDECEFRVELNCFSAERWMRVTFESTSQLVNTSLKLSNIKRNYSDQFSGNTSMLCRKSFCLKLEHVREILLKTLLSSEISTYQYFPYTNVYVYFLEFALGESYLNVLPGILVICIILKTKCYVNNKTIRVRDVLLQLISILWKKGFNG